MDVKVGVGVEASGKPLRKFREIFYALLLPHPPNYKKNEGVDFSWKILL